MTTLATITIKYEESSWDEKVTLEVLTEDELDELTSSGLERANELVKDGYLSGELHESPREDVMFSGWWFIHHEKI